MGDGKPFTIANLTLALRVKVHAAGYLMRIAGINPTASEAADIIRIHRLEDVIAGKHDGKPVKFFQGYELVFGERLKLKRSA